jgi:hypothetical protein
MRSKTNMAVLNVEIPNRTLARTLLQQWAAHPGIVLNVLRGRVTSDGARYKMEVQGSATEVARLLRQIASWEASRPVPVETPA